ncbi:hypothetical protein C3B44_02850 [Corynebacterium yudongzhengii]|uniref:TIGR02569 family protein n=1 Tax=Corynebacterium yudongzhengii TaxID=2080740 RepID=A0A2U1T5B4_9CORY|nr:hypothetical protein [Corynebacterium yudongzhengii]AWB81424.1 hypothetical protein C3B44_02850 [Corynebacterium yudongzhengii]PWC01078.1 hypothetical protein DF222_09315 [Corynebacterium yudongzhengii]
MIPQHVLTAFHAPATDTPPRPLGPAWDNGFLQGTTVYAEAMDTAHWSASLREKLTVDGVRLARPLRTTDGRFTVGRWKANTYITGTPSRRADETVLVALKLADALAHVDGPVGLERTDLYAEAEREAWQAADEKYGPLDLPVQPGHADLLATTLYDGDAVPAVTDLVPFADPRPHAFSAALVIADALIIDGEEGVDLGLLHRFAHIGEIEQLVLRAVNYRAIVAERHPRTNSLTRSNIQRVLAALMSR